MKTTLKFSLFLLFVNTLSGQTSLKDINLKNGKFNVGYKHYTLIDSTRLYRIKNEFNNQKIYRPIPVSIWYPAAQSEFSSKNKVLDYLQILKEEEEWKHLPDYFLLDWFHYLWNTPTNNKHLQENVTAHFNAKALSEKFPVIIYHASFQKTSIENFAMMEYLASHGYVVIATPSRGKNTKDLEGTGLDNITSQLQTMEFLLKHASQLKNTDSSKIELLSYSFGGLVNTILAMKNAKIDALISLDGTERYNTNLLQKLPYYNPNNLKIPYVHFAQKDIPEAILVKEKMSKEINSEFKLFDTISNSNAYRFKFHDLTHTYFNSFDVLFAQRDKTQDKSDEKIMNSYSLLCQYVLQFTNAYLKNDRNSLDFMMKSPAELRHSELISKNMKKAKSKSFDYKDFNDLAHERNYKNLIVLYDSIKKKHPELTLNEGMLNTLGLKLSFDPELFESGYNVFKLALYIYPKSSNLYDSLAEAYYFNKDYNRAIINFKKSLELNPKNSNAINRLKELQD